MAAAELDLDSVDLRVRRGSVPASTQLTEALKAAIVKQRAPRGGRLPSGLRIDRSVGAEPSHRSRSWPTP
ncbi:hypothetical protein MSAS_27380 [Mycobacterium saskatchewanense]|uniref:Uncharacterized protein n=1 Tax=Mycobacterium saskatchewanense TaxID=220927 RepID=A0AAJ3NR53_9MYCO|nr:hypothetical protein AWC23_12790 [Mycobacterium saskatchewanense]BBX63564.1 hypothetical protein MSAS_27380 [Mycobacterium saskatchewanense]